MVIIIAQFTLNLPLLIARILSLVLDIIAVAALLSLLLVIFRRYVTRSPRLDNKLDDATALFLILFIILTGFMLEGLRLSVIGKDVHAWAPAGNVLAAMINVLGIGSNTKGMLTMVVFRIHFFLVLIP